MKHGKVLLLAVINLIFLSALAFWAAKNVSLQEVAACLRTIPAVSLISVLALSTGMLVLYALRMSTLLDSSFRHAFATVILGFGLNGILPLRLGDVAKVVLAKQLFGISSARIVAASAVEKLMDIAAILIIGLAVVQFASFKGIYSGIEQLAMLLVIAVTGLMIMKRLLRKHNATEHRIFAWLNRVMENILRQFKGTRILPAGLYTGAIWAATVFSTYIMFALTYPAFTCADAFLLTLVLVLTIAIPGAPGGLGIVEAGIAGYLHQVLNVDATHAIAAALAFHLATIAPQIAGTIVILIWATMRNKLYWARERTAG